MKATLAIVSAIAAAIILGACDGHTWKETKVLHDSSSEHAAHGDAKAGEHGAGAEHKTEH